MLTFHIGSLLHKQQGAKEEYDIDESLRLPGEGELVFKENVTGRVQFLKLPHEINVQITNMRTKVLCKCGRCLESFVYAIEIPIASREFILDLPERQMEDNEEVYYVNKAANKIDLNDMVREELLLHFPGIPLCSLSCKGLCDKCGINLNKSTCSCERTAEDRVFPFKLPKTG